MARTVALALTFLTMLAGEAQATTFRVLVVPGFELTDLGAYETRGAVGLLVPDAGPETSAARAEAALVRGEVRNSLRGLPEGPALISFGTAAEPLPPGPAIVLGLPEGAEQPNDRRYPIAVIGAGYEGLLTSDSTRIPGLVSIADVAPTALGRDDGLGWESADKPAQALLELDRRIAANNDARFAVTIVLGALVALLAFLWPRAALLGFAAGLAVNLVLGLAGAANAWVVHGGIALAVGAGGPLLAFLLRSRTAIGVALVAVLIAYLVALGLDGPSVALSPLGPSQNARFYGISNLLETLLLVPAFGGAALLARRFGAPAFAAVALVAFVLVAGSRFGADGGGAIVLAGGFVLLAGLLANARPRVVAVAVVAALGLAAALVALDAATGGSSHVTRALEGGPRGLASDLADRISLSAARLAANPVVAVLVTVGIALLALLVVRTLRSEAPPADRAAPLALAAAVAISLVVNDSPNDVVLGGVVGYLALERGMLPRRWAARFSPSRLSSSLPVAAAARPFRRPPRP